MPKKQFLQGFPINGQARPCKNSFFCGCSRVRCAARAFLWRLPPAKFVAVFKVRRQPRFFPPAGANQNKPPYKKGGLILLESLFAPRAKRQLTKPLKKIIIIKARDTIYCGERGSLKGSPVLFLSPPPLYCNKGGRRAHNITPLWRGGSVQQIMAFFDKWLLKKYLSFKFLFFYSFRFFEFNFSIIF